MKQQVGTNGPYKCQEWSTDGTFLKTDNAPKEEFKSSLIKLLKAKGNIPAPSKGCLLEAFKYLKTTNKHPLGAGRLLFFFAQAAYGFISLKSLKSNSSGQELRAELRSELRTELGQIWDLWKLGD